MPNNLSGEQCVSCGAAAAVRVTGTSFCASCGLRQHRGANAAPPTASRRSRRFAIMGILSSGLLAKMLMGAVALAAVGGMTASLRSEAVPAVADVVPVVASADTTTTTTAAVATTTAADVAVPDAASGETPAVANLGESSPVTEYVVAVQAWAECVSNAAQVHSGGAFDPIASCDENPTPGDFGLDDHDDDAAEPPGHDEDGPGNSEDAPGHDEDGPGNSEDAPGHDEDGPGNSENAPGHDEDGPGNSENAPGHDEDGPGNSENAPGHDDGDDEDEQKKDKPPKEKDE